MRSSFLTVALLSLSIVSAGPLAYKRQEDNTTTIGEGEGGASTTTIEGGGGGGGQTTTTTPGTSPSPSPPPASTNDCPPCSQEGHPTFKSESGRDCYCIGGDTDPWSWTDKTCINDSVGLPNDEGKPYLCLGSGGTPGSRSCLNSCNYMLNTVNSLNPCNQNLYNAARACAGCVPGGALRYQVDGRSPSPPYIQGIDSINTFMDGLANWCARPSRCIDLTTGGRISGAGGCPVVGTPSSPASSSAVPGSRQTPGGVVRPGGDSTTGSTTVRLGTGGGGGASTISSRIVTTSTISTTGADGRPTFSLSLATVDNPDFTANTGFATARPVTEEVGGATVTTAVAVSRVIVVVAAAIAALVSAVMV